MSWSTQPAPEWVVLHAWAWPEPRFSGIMQAHLRKPKPMCLQNAGKAVLLCRGESLTA